MAAKCARQFQKFRQPSVWCSQKKWQWGGWGGVGGEGARLGGREQPDKEKELNVFLADGA